MKKVLLLLVALLLVGSLALAESINLGALSDKELLKLRDNVEQEIDERGISEGSNLPNGYYVAGSDIDVGKYIIHAYANKRSGSVILYKDQSSDAINNVLLWQNVYKKTREDVFVSLEEGNVLYINLSKGTTIFKVDKFE